MIDFVAYGKSSHANYMFENVIISPINSTDYLPFTGDFNGDGYDDIFLYAPGPHYDFIFWGAANVRTAGFSQTQCN